MPEINILSLVVDSLNYHSSKNEGGFNMARCRKVKIKMSVCQQSLPDMVVVHALKERIGLYLFDSYSPDPVLLLTAEPVHDMCSLNIIHTHQLMQTISGVRCCRRSLFKTKQGIHHKYTKRVQALISVWPSAASTTVVSVRVVGDARRCILPEDEVFGLFWYGNFWGERWASLASSSPSCTSPEASQSRTGGNL